MRTVAIAFLTGLSVSLSAHANLITNGGFSSDAVGWTYNNQGVDGGYLSGEGNPAGSFWINHNGYNVGSDPDPMLSQVIATVAGNGYTLQFDYSGRVIFGPNGLAVDINGVELAKYSILNQSWLTESLNFTATGPSTTIAFRSEINGSDVDARIDNVSVELAHNGGNGVPEPATLALLGLGLAGLGFARRRAACDVVQPAARVS